MATKRSRTYGEFDAATLRQSMAGPGMDPRQWCSMAVVDADEGSQRSVRYDAPDYGTLVHCTLQPSGIPVICRVGMSGGGAGEGDFEPFAAGDEVVVMIPQGDERVGPVIVSRLNNKVSPAPTRVAGTDIQNNLSGKRRISPYFIESNTSILFRVAATESFISMSQDGNITMASGDKSYLHLGPDFVGLSNGDGSMVLQANANEQSWYIHSNSDTAQCIFRVGGTQPGMFSSEHIYLSSNGQQPWMHLVTFEQVINILAWALGALTSPAGPCTLGPGTALTAGPALGSLLTILQSVTPIDFLVPGAHFTLAALAAGGSQQANFDGQTGLATGIIAS